MGRRKGVSQLFTPQKLTKLTKLKTVQRICLGYCRQPFQSTGVGNRICDKCNQYNLTQSKRGGFFAKFSSNRKALEIR